MLVRPKWQDRSKYPLTTTAVPLVLAVRAFDQRRINAMPRSHEWGFYCPGGIPIIDFRCQPVVCGRSIGERCSGIGLRHGGQFSYSEKQLAEDLITSPSMQRQCLRIMGW